MRSLQPLLAGLPGLRPARPESRTLQGARATTSSGSPRPCLPSVPCTRECHCSWNERSHRAAGMPLAQGRAKHPAAGAGAGPARWPEVPAAQAPARAFGRLLKPPRPHAPGPGRCLQVLGQRLGLSRRSRSRGGGQGAGGGCPVGRWGPRAGAARQVPRGSAGAGAHSPSRALRFLARVPPSLPRNDSSFFILRGRGVGERGTEDMGRAWGRRLAQRVWSRPVALGSGRGRGPTAGPRPAPPRPRPRPGARPRRPGCPRPAGPRRSRPRPAPLLTLRQGVWGHPGSGAAFSPRFGALGSARLR